MTQNVRLSKKLVLLDAVFIQGGHAITVNLDLGEMVSSV